MVAVWFSAIAALLLLLYLGFFLWVLKGFAKWNTLQHGAASVPLISLLIPARNEENNLLRLLNSLKVQRYTGEWEILLIDDHSTDGTAAIVKDFQASNRGLNLRLIAMPGQEGSGSKKAALAYAIGKAAGEIIVCTDADCTMGERWLETITRPFTDEKVQLVSGPVTFEDSPGFFSRFQQLEFGGLVAIGAGTLGNGLPTMCNGANFAYRKSAFHEVGGYSGNEHIPSGDDEFLMHKIHAHFPGGVVFCADSDAVVRSAPLLNFQAFYHQRIRWVSKSTKYAQGHILSILVVAWFFYFTMGAMLILPFINPAFWTVSAVLFLLKMGMEYQYYRKILPMFGQRASLGLVLKSQIPHIVYILLVGIMGNVMPYRWKDRLVDRAILTKATV